MATIDCTVDRNTWWKVYIEYSISQSASTKISTLTHALKLKRIGSARFNGTMNVSYTVGSETFSYNANYNATGMAVGDVATIVSGTTEIAHDDIYGDASVAFSCSGKCNSGGYGTGNINLSSTTINLNRLPIYKLTITAGQNSAITVNRTSSGGNGTTGNLSAGTNKLYYGDKLKITFTPTDNYGISTHTVNGSNFTSGNTHTVSKNVTVVSTATPLSSSIGATDANIGSTSTITITQYNTTYYHTVEYSFGTLTGFIAADGSLLSAAEKYQNTSIPFAIPDIFYAQIPNNATGTCTLTCKTYGSATSTTQIGEAKSCKFIVTASKALCTPMISTQVVDSNETTVLLTGDPSKLIRYKSTALCALTATPKNAATISTLKIGGDSVNITTNSDGTYSGERSYTEVSDTSFSFSVTDSRGYSTPDTASPDIIPYIPLTCNINMYRPSPTGDTIAIVLNGNIYNGSFGATENTLKIQYTYTSGEIVGSGIIDTSSLIYGTSSYSSDGEIILDDTFDYQKSYTFVITATDGADNIILTEVKKPIPVYRGVPVFEWGENDFRFNVPVCGQSFDTDTLTIDGYDVSDLCYKPGDIVNFGNNTFAGYISSTNRYLYFTIPLNKLNKANSVTLSGNIVGRGINGYISDTQWTTESGFINTIDLSGGDGYTTSVTLSNNCINVIFKYTEAITNTTNNTPVIITPVGGDITATFS